MARILLVDPIKASALITKESLRGHQVTVFEYEPWAMVAAFRMEFDLAIINELLGEDPEETKRFARRLYTRNPKLKIIYITTEVGLAAEPGITYVEVLDWDTDKIPRIVESVLARKPEGT